MKHVLNIIICAVVIAALTASAELVTEYFQYGDTYGFLTSFTTADTAGWADNKWTYSSGSRPHYTNWVTAFASLHGEANSYVNTNLGKTVMGNPDGNAGVVYRQFSPALSGTAWISFVVTNQRWGAQVDQNHCRFLINNDAQDHFGVTSPNRTYYGRWWVNENGVAYSNDFAIGNSDHIAACLVVARLRTNYESTYDDITLWVFTNKCGNLNGRTVAALGAEVYQSAIQQDIWGDSINSLGLSMRRNTTSGREIVMDNLRISKGNITDDEHVYEILTGITVPEPGLIGLAALAMMAVRRK